MISFVRSSPTCRVLHGTRGLKPLVRLYTPADCSSRPSRDAWIETLESLRGHSCRRTSRPSRDAWIETTISRSRASEVMSRPSRDAWIETRCAVPTSKTLSSRPSRDAWIETLRQPRPRTRYTSRPSRDAWIETQAFSRRFASVRVASFTGRVD